jgi:hypothetical protein
LNIHLCIWTIQLAAISAAAAMAEEYDMDSAEEEEVQDLTNQEVITKYQVAAEIVQRMHHICFGTCAHKHYRDTGGCDSAVCPRQICERYFPPYICVLTPVAG